MSRSSRGRSPKPDHSPRSAPLATSPEVPIGPLREESGRLLLAVHVTPRAGRDAISVASGTIRVRLTAAPVDGAANEALAALLASRLRVPRRSVTLVRGATSREKLVAIDGLSAADCWARLDD